MTTSNMETYLSSIDETTEEDTETEKNLDNKIEYREPIQLSLNLEFE